MKKISLRSLYQTIGKHIDEPFIITSHNKDAALVTPVEGDCVILTPDKLKKLDEEGKIGFTHNDKIYVVAEADVTINDDFYV
jgi:hypothetical protein